MKKSAAAADPDTYPSSLDGWQRTCVATLRAFVRENAALEETIKWGNLVRRNA